MKFALQLEVMSMMLALLFHGFVDAKTPDVAETLKRDAISIRGTWEEIEVPDTLDLAERARLAINGLTGNLVPESFYSNLQAFDLNVPSTNARGMTWNITPENLRALPLLRTMCGSEQGTAIEYHAMRTCLEQIDHRGLMFYPLEQDGAARNTSYPQVNATMACAMANWYYRDGNQNWLEWIRLISLGLGDVMIRVNDRAYFPNESSIGRDGKWHWTEREGRESAPIPYQPPDEPIVDHQGLEGAVKCDHGRPIEALAINYQLNKEASSLDTAKLLNRFVLKRQMWEDEQELNPGNEHGIYAGHNHNNLMTLAGMLTLAKAKDDVALKQFVREAYHYSIRSGVVQLGFFPGWVRPEKCHRPASARAVTETCAVADALMLAVQLSDLGLGDYWDDVDYIVRNHLSESQMIDLQSVQSAYGINEEGMALLQRFQGAFFSSPSPVAVPSGFGAVAGCCSANGALSLYYAWHGITRFQDGVATVNLFLNRSSPWLDVDSYLPYEGKVVLHNKQAKTILVRVPSWLQPQSIRCFVSDKPTHPAIVDRRLVFSDVLPQQSGEATGRTVIRLEFDVPEQVVNYSIDGKSYSITFRGSSVVDIQPRESGPQKYAMYQREYMRAAETPKHKVRRFVPDKIIPLP
jgi:hypothetical protein